MQVFYIECLVSNTLGWCFRNMLSKKRMFRLLAILLLCIIVHLLHTRLLVDSPSKKARPIDDNSDIFRAILDIRMKNCKLWNEGNDSICQELKECNSTKTSIPHGASSCDKRLPGCLVIGVEKGGTREVLDLLMMNHMVTVKTKPYFGTYFNNRSFDKGIDWYRSQMPYSTSRQMTVEKGNYFFESEVPGRIRELNPDIKMLLMIRDPVYRYFSLATYRSSVEETLARLKKMKPFNPANTVQRTRYDVAFKRYLQYFKRSQILVVDSGRLKHDPFGVLSDIETFLGLPHAIRKDDLVFNDEKGFYCVRAVGKMHSVCFNENRGRKTNGDDPFEAYKPELRRQYKQINTRFFKLIGQEFNWQ